MKIDKLVAASVVASGYIIRRKLLTEPSNNIKMPTTKSPFHPGGRPTGRFKAFASGVFAFPGRLI